MVKCLACDGESPDGSLHCVHCGTKMGGGAARTAFGLPAVRPQGGRIGDQGTQQMSPDAEAMSTPMPLSSAPADTPSPAQSLLAGLPRPRVSSAPSPLTGGIQRRDSSRRQQPSARSTVMGMPIFAAPVPDSAAAAGSEATPAGASAGAGIRSLDSASGEKPGGSSSISNLDSFGRVVSTPSEAQVDAAAAAAGEAVEPADSGAATAPSAPAMDPSAVGIREKPTTGASGVRPTPTPGPEFEPEGNNGSRWLAVVVGVTLLALFVYPIGKDWFFNAFGRYAGTAQLAFAGIGISGAMVLSLAVLPMAGRTRALLSVVIGAVGLACLALV